MYLPDRQLVKKNPFTPAPLTTAEQSVRNCVQLIGSTEAKDVTCGCLSGKILRPKITVRFSAKPALMNALCRPISIQLNPNSLLDAIAGLVDIYADDVDEVDVDDDDAFAP